MYYCCYSSIYSTLSFPSEQFPIAFSTSSIVDQQDLITAEEDISDSNAILAHVASQEQMVIDRLRQTGGEIAVQELKEKFSVVETPPITETETETAAVEQHLEEPVREDDPLPAEGHDSHTVTLGQEPDTEKSGPSDEFYEDMAKMEMAHEIVMNSDYKIEKQEPEG